VARALGRGCSTAVHPVYSTSATWAFLRHLVIEGRLHPTHGPVKVRGGVGCRQRVDVTLDRHGMVANRQWCLGILETACVSRNVEECLPIGLIENVSDRRETIRSYREECDAAVAAHGRVSPPGTRLGPTHNTGAAARRVSPPSSRLACRASTPVGTPRPLAVGGALSVTTVLVPDGEKAAGEQEPLSARGRCPLAGPIAQPAADP
jgi:hypothetical protein